MGLTRHDHDMALRRVVHAREIGLDIGKHDIDVIATHEVHLGNVLDAFGNISRVQGIQHGRHAMARRPGFVIEIAGDRDQPRHIIATRSKQGCKDAAAGNTDQLQSLRAGFVLEPVECSVERRNGIFTVPPQ